MTGRTARADADIVLSARQVGIESGETLVLLHGFGGSGHSFDPVLEDLGRKARLILPDLPGHGGSVEVGGKRHPRAGADAVLSTLDRLGIEHFHLGGFSMGGAVACLIAMKAPGRVKSLTLVAPGGFGPEIAAATLRQFARARSREELRDALSRMVAPGAEVPETDLAALEAERRDEALVGELTAIAEMITRDDRQGELPRESLAAIECPVRVLWGTDDPVLPVTQSRDLPDGFALRRIEGAGHMLLHEAREAVTDAFLAALSDERAEDRAS